MKILLHSNAPWVNSGYGKQARYAGQILRGLGHEVVYSSFAGLYGQRLYWDEFLVLPSGRDGFGADVIVPHAQEVKADVILTVMDTWKLLRSAELLKDLMVPFVPFVITDCMAPNGGPSLGDQAVLHLSGALPVAVSRFGQERLLAMKRPEGWDVPPYVPHTIDTGVYKPPTDRTALREQAGHDDDYVIGICAANRDWLRKGYPEQMAAFARFRRKHPEARLSLFTMYDGEGGLPLGDLASDFGILERCSFLPSYPQETGMFSDEFCASWFGSLDLLSGCSYGEGFGIPLVEALACGTPVVATDCSAMTELVKPAGWLASGKRFWNPTLRAWWTRPDEDAILAMWEKAYAERLSRTAVAARRRKSVQAAADYDIAVVREQHWRPFLKQLEGRL